MDLSGYALSDVSDYEYIGLAFAWDFDDDAAIEVSNLVLFVPEPSSTALLGLGGLALMLRRKRS